MSDIATIATLVTISGIIFGLVRAYYSDKEKQRSSISLVSVVQEHTERINHNSDEIETIKQSLEKLEGKFEIILLRFDMVLVNSDKVVNGFNKLIIFLVEKMGGNKGDLSDLLISYTGVKGKSEKIKNGN